MALKDEEQSRLHQPVREATFDSLMPHRVHDILVVASPYDAFVIEEGGHLTELILNEYVSLNLSFAPSLTRASSAEEALDLLMKKRFDVVFTLLQVGTMDGFAFGRKIKSLDPSIPVVLLAFDHAQLERRLAQTPWDGVDHLFIWQADARLFVAIIKMIEDGWNVDHDTAAAQVRTILLVEDSLRFASLYLPLLYTELVEQTQNLLDDSVNLTQRMLRMRARPKVLWAQDYESAIRLYERHRRYMLGVITDLSFPRDGKRDPRAGVELIRRIKEDDPTLPILLQSSLAEGQDLAKEVGVHFLNKRSRKLLKQLQGFIRTNFGFGDFVFLMPDGTVWGRAGHLRDLEEKLEQVPDASLAYHARRNDFSNWLRARTEFGLATKIRPRQVEEFEGMDDLRRYLIHTLQVHRSEAQRGIVADFSPSRFDAQSEFVRIGGGSLGGKGRGLAFANAMLQSRGIDHQFSGVRIGVPLTAVIGTDVFDSFMMENDLEDLAYGSADDDTVAEAFLAADLPDSIREDLVSFLDRVKYPLAVRSSSLLEDSRFQPFAGIYRTYMLPNSHADPWVRLSQLSRAIKLVYASTFSEASKAYIESTPYRVEDEKMAVVLQQLVGAARGDRYYPNLSGVARSYNFYPIAPMRAHDGIAVVALGLGRQVVAGGEALRFCPAHPRNIPQFSSVRATLESSQHMFYALDLSQPARMPERDELANLLHLDVEQAFTDRAHVHLASTYSYENHTIHEGLSRDGYPVLTFAPVLKSEAYPLASILQSLLTMGSEGMGAPVEIEFAMDLTEDPAWFGFLQMRRLVVGDEPEDVRIDFEDISRAICFSGSALGNGKREGVYDLVYVRPDRFDPGRSQTIASEVGKLNRTLRADHRPYLLIGPGRWGSSDPWLGVPVTWDQISGACTIVETALEDFRVTPSQGTHFFQNMTSLGIGYFTVNPFLGEDRMDWDWLNRQTAVYESDHVRHLRFEESLLIRIDGRSGRGLVLPPANHRGANR